MSELYSTSETAEPASQAGAASWHETSSGHESADSPRSDPDAAQDKAYAGDGDYGSYSDADLEATLAAEERLPESRTRQEAAAGTWDDTIDDAAGNELATEYDGDVEALLAAEERLPEPRTRQEAAAETWDDTPDPGNDDPGSFSGDPASEYDGDVEALLAAEERLPEPRTRQEAAAAAWGETTTGQHPDGNAADGSDTTGSQAAEDTILDDFRAVPVEGAGNKPVDPGQRPWADCYGGDPPVKPGDLTHRDEFVYCLSDGKGAGHPDSSLAGPDAVPQLSHTAEERAEKAAEGRARAAEVIGKPNWANAKYAGEVFYDKLTPELKTRFPDGVQFTYEGFPMFDRYAVKTVRFEDGFAPLKANGRADRPADDKRANAIFGWNATPEGTTWHHKEDSRTMLLVDRGLHEAVRHWGGIRVNTARERKDADA
jgi:hypothetical protein